jgi:hypothetical protein
MKNAPCIVTIIAMLTVTSCQRRALCKTKTPSGATSFIRIYKGNFNSTDEYSDAINQYKANGYTCDDSISAAEE